MNVLFLFGPNLGALGRRDPDTYGSQTLAVVGKYVRIGRGIATSGPVDEGFPNATWIKAPSATPLERMFGLYGSQNLDTKVQTATAAGKDGVWTAKLIREVQLDSPAWFAARIDSTTKNELDRQLYAHTSPVYVDLGGRRVFDVEAARLLLKRMEDAREAIRARGRFADEPARDAILAVYDETARDIVKRINARGR